MLQYPYVDQHYVPHVQPARASAQVHRNVRALLSDELDATAQLGFLIEFSALGVRLLRPVEDSLARAALVCVAVGLDALGDELQRLGTQAAQRRLLLIDDLVQLAQLWREQVSSAGRGLDLAALVRRTPPDVAHRHAQLREAASADELPLAALGVELELGQFAVSVGPQLMRACERKLGAQVFVGLSYLQARTDHAALGTDRLHARLDDLLRAAPELGQSIASAGAQALRAHIEVLGACISRGRHLIENDVLETASRLSA
ncbi:hypothetical protein DB30_06293 [Enhygromyxa salina]|uniref:Uncharacterized protein n=1 Tax=Enhygromyxa salina TaxID=215803 RepID=A0A0C2CYX2_9BACT|nr:hypothetical protein [Enhygromyxa salina]KIG14840.1 hypothetical protein DB30_06293 [Enhygromyxa salina]